MEDGHFPRTPHKLEVPLPPDIGRLIATIMERAEEAEKHYLKERRRARRAYWFALGTIVVYLGLILWELIAV